MSDDDTDIQLRGLRDPRLAAQAASANPAWLWTPDGTRVLWANPPGAMLLGASTSAGALSVDLDPADRLRLQVTHLAGRLSPNGATRLERLRGFGGPFGRLMTFACARLVLGDGVVGVLVAGTEPIGTRMPLAERLRRLIDGISTPLAAFTADGVMSFANESARPLLGTAADLNGLGLEAVRADVLRDGRAEMLAAAGRFVLVRVGIGADAAIVAIITPVPAHLRTADLALAAARIATPAAAAEPAAPDAREEETLPHVSAATATSEAAAMATDVEPHPPATDEPAHAPPGSKLEPEAPATDATPAVAVADAAPATDAPDAAATPLVEPDESSLEEFFEPITAPPMTDAESSHPVEPAEPGATSPPASESAHASAPELPSTSIPALADDTVMESAAGSSDVEPSAPPPSQADAPPRFIEPPAEPRRHPLRFMWQMDADGRFSLGTDEFVRLIGPQTAAAMGRPWNEIADAFRLDPTGEVARAVATRDTWSGIVVDWPADDNGYRLPVELSGLPVYDAARQFIGYRGFGVCRDLDALTRLAAHRRAATNLTAVAPPTPPISAALAAATPDVTVTSDTTDAIASPSSDAPRNVVPFPGTTEARAPGLSAVENHAFNELARKLSERLNAETAPAGASASVANAALQSAPAIATLAHHAVAASEAHTGNESAVLDRLPMGILVYRLDHLIYANRAFLARTGYESLHALAQAGGLDALFVEAGPAIASSDSENGTPLVVSTARGSQTPIAARLFSVTWDDANALALVFTTTDTPPAPASIAALRDTAPLDTAQAAIDALSAELAAERRRAAQAIAARADLLNKISHEIRAPLGTISGFADVMIDERFGPLGNERYSAYMKDIRSSSERVLGIVNDLIALSNVEAGHVALTPTAIDLNALVEDCVAGLQDAANRERVIIRTALAPAPATIRADAQSLRQIADHLVGTAIRLAKSGGQVIVSTAVTDSGGVALRVRDTGPGLTEQQRAAALEPYRTAEDTQPDADGGINLALTKALAEANGARFSLTGASSGHGGSSAGTLMEVVFPALPV